MSITRRSIRSRHSLAVLGALLCAASCSGGFFGGDSGGASSGSNHGKYFLVVSGGLLAVDPLDPKQLYSFGTDSVVIFDYAVGGEFNPESQSLLDPGNELLVYAKGDRLYTVDLEIERLGGVVQPPEPVELATFSAAVEEVTVEEDYSVGDGERTYLVRVDNAYEVVAERDGTPTLPAPFPGTPVASLMDPATGAFLGWLALDDGGLIRVDRDQKTQFLTLADEARKLGDTCDVFLLVDEQLMSFDVATGALVDIGHTLGPHDNLRCPRSVGGTLFFQVQGPDIFNWDIYRTDQDGPVASIASWSFQSFHTMFVLETRLVYKSVWVVGGPLGLTMNGIELDGSDPVELDGGKMAVITFPFGKSPVHGDTVFYELGTTSSDSRSTFTVNADGSGKTEHPGGRWLGRQLASEILLDRAPETERLFWLADIPATISAVDPADPTGTLHTIGVLPPTVATFELGPSYGDAHLCYAYKEDGTLHLYFFDAGKTNSLVWLGVPP